MPTQFGCLIKRAQTGDRRYGNADHWPGAGDHGWAELRGEAVGKTHASLICVAMYQTLPWGSVTLATRSP
jgi:hypothetical protein